MQASTQSLTRHTHVHTCRPRMRCAHPQHHRRTCWQAPRRQRARALMHGCLSYAGRRSALAACSGSQHLRKHASVHGGESGHFSRCNVSMHAPLKNTDTPFIACSGRQHSRAQQEPDECSLLPWLCADVRSQRNRGNHGSRPRWPPYTKQGSSTASGATTRLQQKWTHTRAHVLAAPH
jgi:hypothetical protein